MLVGVGISIGGRVGRGYGGVVGLLVEVEFRYGYGRSVGKRVKGVASEVFCGNVCWYAGRSFLVLGLV